MKKLIYLPLSLCMGVGLFSDLNGGNKKGNEIKWTYRSIGAFSSYKTSVAVEQGKITEYSLLFDKSEPTPEDSAFFRTKIPGWKGGDIYGAMVYRWVENQFVRDSNNYYTDNAGKKRMAWDDYDHNEIRNLKLPDRYMKISKIYSALLTGIVKAYVETDLNLDKKQDFVMVYKDTSGQADWLTYSEKNNYHLVIFENSGSGKYVEIFSHDFQSERVFIGKVEIKEVTLDSVPEVILWSFSQGASGYSECVAVFSRVKK